MSTGIQQGGSAAYGIAPPGYRLPDATRLGRVASAPAPGL